MTGYHAWRRVKIRDGQRVSNRRIWICIFLLCFSLSTGLEMVRLYIQEKSRCSPIFSCHALLEINFHLIYIS